MTGLPGILGSFVAGLASLGMTTKDFFYRDCTTSTNRECGGYQLGYQVCVCVCAFVGVGVGVSTGVGVGVGVYVCVYL